jgi:uncharacterized protein (TIGR02246 family)
MGKADIEAGEAAWQKAFNGGDASGVTELYTQDARLMPPNTDIVAGRDSIEGFVKEFVATGAQIKFNLLTVYEAGDVATAVGTYEMSIPIPGADAQQDTGKYIEVWKRESDGAWRIADDIFNSSLPAAPG